MKTLVLEVRDRLTCIPVMAIQMAADDPTQAFYLRRCGFSDGLGVILMKINDQAAHSDIYDWRDRTMRHAHEYIIDNFDKLNHGDVIDVRTILGETAEPAKSERFE